ncbi:MAG: hypothetical protein AAGH72_11130 [Verrucomicrobiota bacterium]
MARRARSHFSPVHLTLGAVLLLLIAGAGYLFLAGNDSNFRTLPVLEVEAYLENANSLRGNTYRLKGTINHSLAWDSAVGRLFSVQVGVGRNARLVPVLIPAQLNDINVQRGQDFQIKIEVVENGLLRVLEMEKS